VGNVLQYEVRNQFPLACSAVIRDRSDVDALIGSYNDKPSAPNFLMNATAIHR